jgi:hypothetical protein
MVPWNGSGFVAHLAFCKDVEHFALKLVDLLSTHARENRNLLQLCVDVELHKVSRESCPEEVLNVYSHSVPPLRNVFLPQKR